MTKETKDGDEYGAVLLICSYRVNNKCTLNT